MQFTNIATTNENISCVAEMAVFDTLHVALMTLAGALHLAAVSPQGILIHMASMAYQPSPHAHVEPPRVVASCLWLLGVRPSYAPIDADSGKY